jgi:hypothetical protein
MSDERVNVDTAATDQRFKKLKSLYREIKVAPEPDFNCQMFKECNKAFAARNAPLAEIPHASRGCQSYLGKRFDLRDRKTNVPLRIVIIGMDHGDEAKDLHYWAVTPTDRNPQNMGIRKILSALFGEDMEDTELLNRYASLNILKCGSNRMTSWGRPKVMFNNCVNHLRRELEILEPTLIVTQSHDDCFEPLRAQLATHGWFFESLVDHKYGLWRASREEGDGAWRESYVIDSPHPADRRGLFKNVFLPHFRNDLASEVRKRMGLSW